MVADRAAVEQVPDSARTAGFRPAEIHAGQPAAMHFDATLFAHLAAACLPGRLPVRFHDATRDRPAGLVSRLEDQQPARPVEDERPGRYRDGRQIFVPGGRISIARHDSHYILIKWPGSPDGAIHLACAIAHACAGRSFLGSLLTTAA